MLFLWRFSYFTLWISWSTYCFHSLRVTGQQEERGGRAPRSLCIHSLCSSMGHSVGRSFRSFLHCMLFFTFFLHFGYGFFFFLYRGTIRGLLLQLFFTFLSFPFLALYRGVLVFFCYWDVLRRFRVFRARRVQSLALMDPVFHYIYCTKSNKQIRKETEAFARSAQVNAGSTSEKGTISFPTVCPARKKNFA